MAGPGSPGLPIARPEAPRLILSPHTVAVSVAERYVAGLVGQCQTIASLFEVEVPIPMSRVTMSEQVALTSEASLGSESLGEPQPCVFSPGKESSRSPSRSASGALELQSPLSTRPSRSVPEATAHEAAPQFFPEKARMSTSPVCNEPSPWGGPRASESMRLMRLLDPEFRRRSSLLSTMHRQSNAAANVSPNHKDTAGDTPASPSTASGHSPRHPNVQPPASRSRQHRPSPYHRNEASGLRHGPAHGRTPNHRPSTNGDHCAEHGAAAVCQRDMHAIEDAAPSRAKNLRMSQVSAPRKRSPGFEVGSRLGQTKVALGGRIKGKQRTAHTPSDKRTGTFDQWDARRNEAQRHQLHRVEKVEEKVAPPDMLEQTGLKEDLRIFFRETCHKSKSNMVDDTVDGWELHQIALELQMSVDDVLLVKSVFDTFDDNRSGTLDIEEFELAVSKLLQLQLRDQMVPTERVKSMCEWYWWDGDKDNSGTIDFREFLRWYSSNGFNEDLLLTEQQRCLRKIAKQHKVSPDYVEHIKRCFDLIDVDKSNEVDINEFKQVLYKALKVPMHLELPPSRVQYFWAEIDTDGSGQAGFEEFFAWWVKYFDAKGEADQMPFEAFYKQIRRIGVKYLDPPAYPPKEPFFLDDDEDGPGSNWLENMLT